MEQKRTLEVGDRSGLIIGPSGANYTVTSSNPDTVAVEQVLTFWVAIAKAEGIAEITVSNSAGERGTVILTVGSAAPAAPEAPASGDSAGLTDNLEIRQEMIWLINQTRKDNGVSELPVSEALMNAAQACSDRRYTWHHALEESQAAVDAGYPYGFGDNLTVFTGTADAAQRAVDNWINSPGHFETMIDSRVHCIGRPAVLLVEVADTHAAVVYQMAVPLVHTALGLIKGFNSLFTGTQYLSSKSAINSPGHFETMIDSRCDCIGVGMTQYDGITYCYMFVGIPNSVNFYA